MPWPLLFIAFVFGAVLASFMGVVVARYGTGEPIARGRSRCDACNRPLSALALVPILSYAAQRGRARCCGARIPLAAPVSEALLGALFALSVATLGPSPALLPFLLALLALYALVAYDLLHQILPPPFLAVFVLFAALAGWLASPSLGAFFTSLSIAAGIAAFFLVLYFASRGRWMGFSDAPLAFGLALLVGPLASIPGFIFTFWIGAVIGIGILLARPAGSRIGIEVPLAPFLAAGFLLAYFTAWNPFPFPGLF